VRLTLALLGWTLDWSLEPTTAEAEADDGGRDMGSTSGTYVGFTAAHDVPDEAAIHHQCSPYEDDSEAGHG
jgi:hypothetical protein